MNKPLSITEFEQTQILSRKEKLFRWSMLVETHPTECRMLHNLEYKSPQQLREAPTGATIFEIAGKDPVFMSAGLAGSDVWSCKEFFELEKNDLHLLACDCMGEADNEEVSNRIMHIAHNI